MIKSVQKALNILNYAAQAHDWVGVREIAGQIGLKVTTTQQILKTLQAESYLDFDDATRRYRIGIAALKLSEGNDQISILREYTEPFMKMLRAETNETVVALVMDKNRVNIVNWKKSNHILAVIHSREFFIDHPHLLASGLALLAYMPEDFKIHYARNQNFSSFTGNTPQNPEELLALFEKVGKNGFAITENVVNSEITAIGVPVFRANGTVLMALGCSFPSIRKSPEKMEFVRELLMETAEKMRNF